MKKLSNVEPSSSLEKASTPQISPGDTESADFRFERYEKFAWRVPLSLKNWKGLDKACSYGALRGNLSLR